MLDLVAIGINGIIGTGIFFLPGSVAASMGPAAVITFAISAVLCGLLVLCFAEVSSRFTGTGGAMIYSDAAFGPLVGFGVGWLTWVVRVAAWGALSNGFVDALGALAPTWAEQRLAVLALLFAVLTVINLLGVRHAAVTLNLFTIAKLVPIVLFVGVGVFHLDSTLYTPFAPHGYDNLGSATLVMVFAFVGFEILVVPGGESVDPKKDLPRSLLVVMGTVTLIYMLIWLVCAGTLPTLAGSATPVSDAAATFMGPVGASVITVGILLSVAGINSGTALIGPRCLYALAEKGTIPSVFGWTHARWRTPVVAILVTSIVSFVVAASGSFVELAVISTVARFGQYIPSCFAVIRLRQLHPEEPPGFRVPGGGWVALLAIGLCVWLLSQAEPRQLGWGVVALLVGYALHVPVRLHAARRKPSSHAA